MNVSFRHLRVLFSPWKSTLILCELNLGIWESIFGSGSWFWVSRGWVLASKSRVYTSASYIWPLEVHFRPVGFNLGNTESILITRKSRFTLWESILGAWESILHSRSWFCVSESQLWASWSWFLDLWESTFGLRVKFGPLKLYFWSIDSGFGVSLLVSHSQKFLYFFIFPPSSNNKYIFNLDVP